MKTTKYTMAALALIAAAAITTSAKAATGDIILGIYDTNINGVTQSYEVDLGLFSSLTPNETFNLGSSIQDLFGADAPAQLVFNIAGTGALAGGGSLVGGQIAFTASTLPNLYR